MANLYSRLRPTQPQTVDNVRGRLVALHNTWAGTEERAANDFATYAAHGYAGNGVVFAVMAARMMMFSEANWALSDNPNDPRAGAITYNSTDLSLIQNRRLKALADIDVSLAGNHFLYRPTEQPGLVQRWRPDWTGIVMDENTGEVIGYQHRPGGTLDQRKWVTATRREVVHWAPKPDPTAVHRGMSWLNPIAREVDADTNMARHRNQFFSKNNAVPAGIVKVEQNFADLPPGTKERLRAEMEYLHGGVENAYKTAIMEGGMDYTVVGRDFQQMDFRLVQGAGETRICNAGEVPPVIVGVAEGLQAATYSNYAHAMRRWADIWARPTWGAAAAAYASIVRVPPGFTLWYDDRYIPALQQDAKDEAEIRNFDAKTINDLVRWGWTPESAQAAVVNNDLSLLVYTDGLVPSTLLQTVSANPAAPT